jgi:23S rRNA (adenine2503-C2)-methyltransferase
MNLERLKETLKNEPKYRLKQAREAVFKNLVADWSEATSLPPKLREELNRECPLAISGKVMESDVGGETMKAMIIVEGGLAIEAVLMRHGENKDNKAERNTVCVSSQIGCPMRCKFCATGAMGFKRNLSVSEITEQVLFFARLLEKKDERVSNVVFMGMGEPFLNYNNVLEAIRTFNDKDGLNIGARKISVSTCGIIEGIEKLSREELQVNLAISLHAPDNDLRSQLMPVNMAIPLAKVLKAVDAYIKKTGRQVMFEYLLLQGVNDTEEHAKKLAALMENHLYFVNLIVYNRTGQAGLEPSPAKSVKKFREILEKAGVGVSERYRFGRGIKAACGQLVFKP